MAGTTWLTCVDAHSGKVLWQKRVLPLLCDGKTPEEAARLQQVIDIAAVPWILRGQSDESRPGGAGRRMFSMATEGLQVPAGG